MTETEKEYYTRRGREERKRARGAATPESHSFHDDIANLYREKANGSTNENGKTGIRRPGPRGIRLVLAHHVEGALEHHASQPAEAGVVVDDEEPFGHVHILPSRTGQ